MRPWVGATVAPSSFRLVQPPMETPHPVDLGRIAQDLQIRRVQVESVVALLDEKHTVPFIARYRRDRTGGLSEGLIREIRVRVARARELIDRKAAILQSLTNANLLNEDLEAAIRGADSPKRLDDLYLPYKPRRRSRTAEARASGLEALALRVWNHDETLTDLNGAAGEFLNPEKGLDSTEKVLDGARAILAESISELSDIRDSIRRLFWRHGKIVTSKNESVPEGKGGDFRDFFQFSEPASHIPPHRVLAINRGEREGTLKVRIEVPRTELERTLLEALPLDGHPHREFFTSASESALDQILYPAMEREVRRDLTEVADRHAMDVLARNMRGWLLQPPIEPQTLIAIDPGRKTLKVAVLDAQGKLLEHATLQLGQPIRRHEAKQALKDLVVKHQTTLIALGNGSSCREAEELITEMINEGTHFHTNPGVPFPTPPPRSHDGKKNQSPAGDATTSEQPAAEESHAEPAREETGEPVSEAGHTHEPEAVLSMAAAEGTEPDAGPTPAEHDSTPPESGELGAAEWQVPPIEGGSTDGENHEAGGEGGELGDPSTSAHFGDAEAGESGTREAGDSAAPDASAELATDAGDGVPIVEHEPRACGLAEASIESQTEPPIEVGHADPSVDGAAKPPAAAPSMRPLTAPPLGTTKPKPEQARVVRTKTPPPPPAAHAADELLSRLHYVVVNEAGVKTYASSNLGREELPDIDTDLRSAISIGRRLLNPLAELVKVDPEHVGVGQYQHDINSKVLAETLRSVVEHCVNHVGVDLNTAEAALLARVSGLNDLLARRIVEYRAANGPFTSREGLKAVEGITDAVYLQAAGFLRVPGAAEPLDGSAVHPESYELVARLFGEIGESSAALTTPEGLEALKAKFDGLDLAAKSREHGLSEPAFRDLLDALLTHAKDVREGLPKPIPKRGQLRLEDLKPGTELKGTVLNVVDFGAFVDIGLKDSGLVHISVLANRFVRDAHDVVSVGDVVTVWVIKVEKDRKRVSLTMVPPGSERVATERTESGPRGPRRGDGRGPGGPEGGRPPGGRRGGPGGRGQGGGGDRRPPGPRGEHPDAGSGQGEGAGDAGGAGATRTASSRIPGPPMRLQQGRGRGGPGGRGGRPGPGGRGGGPKGGGRPGGAAEGPAEQDKAASKPKSKPIPQKPVLSSDERAGNRPLRSLSQLKSFFESRGGEESDTGAPNAEQGAADPNTTPPADSGASSAGHVEPPSAQDGTEA